MEVKVCPKCHSQDISLSSMFKFEQRGGLLRDECKNCGYIGTMVIMEKEDADKLNALDPENESE